MKNFPRIGTEYIVPLPNDIVNWILDSYTFMFLQLWFLPTTMMAKSGEADKFLSQFSLNGIKSTGTTTTICRP
jgi:hypothetical protein